MLFNYALLLIAYKTAYLKKTRINIIVICLCAMCIFLTGARSCIIGAVMCTGMLFSKLKVSQIFFIFLIFPFVFVFAGDYLSQILDSIFNTEKVNGSNSEMRLIQFMISWDYMMHSPIIGNGLGFLYNDDSFKPCRKRVIWCMNLCDLGSNCRSRNFRIGFVFASFYFTNFILMA